MSYTDPSVPPTTTTTTPTTTTTKTPIERYHASVKRRESTFFAALAHSLKDCSIDPHGFDQWHLPLTLGTVLAYLLLRRWEIVFLIFAVFYLFEYALFFVLKALTRGSTAAITSRHQRSRELLTDPLVFSLALFVAWYIIDYSVIGSGDGASGSTPWWRSALLLLVVAVSGHARLYWASLATLVGAVWATHCVVLLASSSHHKHEHSLWLSLRATGFALFFYAAFLVPIGGHFLQNALFALLLALFFSSAIHFISLG